MKKLWSYRGIDEDGHLAVLLWPSDLFGKCVYVQQAEAILDASAVSASIDSLPYFSRDGPVAPGSHPSIGSARRHAHVDIQRLKWKSNGRTTGFGCRPEGSIIHLILVMLIRLVVLTLNGIRIHTGDAPDLRFAGHCCLQSSFKFL